LLIVVDSISLGFTASILAIGVSSFLFGSPEVMLAPEMALPVQAGHGRGAILDEGTRYLSLGSKL
jgi:hypothetical protein